MKKPIFLIAVLYAFSTGVSWAQKDSVDYFSLSLEELMNIQIVSASKKAESLFDAPLSASVLTREEIRNAGSTSIMEALRLIPGVIVREQTNGNYDIHVRGLDNVPPNSLILSSTNTTTLVMINNRPVYNYLQGGTFWESLPIDLNDVEKIEVVRGPSSTLYGPNAVSGVINIITRHTDKQGWSVNGSTQYGTQNTSILNGRAAYQFNDKWSVAVSGNYQDRGRDVVYINNRTGEKVTSIDDLGASDVNARYPHPDKSMIKYGVNSTISYSPKEKAQFNLNAGLQDSEVQNIMFDNTGSSTNINTITTDSRYVDFQSSTYGLNTQISYTDATQYPVKGMKGSQYDYNVTDASLEYEIPIKGLSLKPGVTYRSATYDDSRYANVAEKGGILNGEKTMETLGGSLRADYSLLNEKLRFTGGLRMDKFTHPGDWLLSYQAAVNYKLNTSNLFRVVYSKAYRSPFIFDTYVDYHSLQPLANNMFMEASSTGNKNLDLLNSKMFELGYRTMLRSNLSLDIEGYHTITENYTALILGATTITPQTAPVIGHTSLTIENIPLKVRQQGVTVSVNYVVNKLQIKPFVSFQKTKLEDYSPYFSSTAATPSASNNMDPATYNFNNVSDVDHKFTPSAYGGAYINYALSSKFNFNLNAYWFSKQTFYHKDNFTYKDGVRGVENIDSKVLLNATVSYAPIKQLRIFVNGRNLLNRKSIEYYNSDATPAMIFGGINFDF
ncbi:TonB-dependent receptor plug domain-containing protein [Chryseosolibacter indicus]|uniref:TonB-dependent receptor n=1 Tax=Chryseosolibacter indicus TaxID=2782351 RepID=A0ABS5VVF8_9BACT|nr:TonB-dependent receptor [Chryseosolibacter indicus]MBT1705038.1 TonB-dependent receptor [Chryseosolibacter indicus]